MEAAGREHVRDHTNRATSSKNSSHQSHKYHSQLGNLNPAVLLTGLDPSWSSELSRYTAVTSAQGTTSRGLNSSFIFPKCLCFFIFQTLWEKTPAIAAFFLLQAGKSTQNIRSIKQVTQSFLALLTCPK